jgi:hypothetical protein
MCVRVYMRMCNYVCIYASVCMYVYMYVFTYVCLQLAVLKNLTMSQTKYQRSGLVEIELK